MAIQRKPMSSVYLGYALGREAILKKAHLILLNEGGESVTLTHVAAGMESPNSIFEFFDSTDELVDELTIRVSDFLLSVLKRTLKNESPRIEITRVYIDFAREHRAEFLLLFGKTSLISEQLVVKVYQMFVRAFTLSEKNTGNIEFDNSFAFWEATHKIARQAKPPLVYSEAPISDNRSLIRHT